MKLKNLPWIPFALFAIAIGLYPLIYYFVDMHNKGLFQSKPAELLRNPIWHTAFYLHISFGGLALLIGWTQFSKKLRGRYLNAHRLVGKIYVLSVFISSCAGLYIALFASGGIICSLGFGTLALLWLFTDIQAYTSIRKLRIAEHEAWMIRNYALAFAAVTLRIWLPLTTGLGHMDFVTSYRIISWLCWVPNLIIAELIIRRKINLISN
ncbi:DUF2306 domain-containing protein [Mucilaginibacter flavidus]|uniref:DUF2306 domain-containing protein n=1 Tax=Mucilaginibacter flavidus TaxID=2949309 RepID=UPI002093A652|nr:DUF2306 domain-containing protein [Mucilaginibacter flavidus]MCO5951058.1 DUF2306 domain-containing protein [Mucilaginibacter flavidus]